MLVLFAEMLMLILLAKSLDVSFHNLLDEVEQNVRLEKKVFRLEYCARFYALQKNLNESGEYSQKGALIGEKIIKAWQQDMDINTINCDELKNYISIYKQLSPRLDPTYPNWSYYYYLSNTHNDIPNIPAY